MSPILPPQQQRTRESWARVLQVGVDVLKEAGFDGLTIETVCRRAGVKPPTIYARVGSKDGLNLAVYEAATAEIHETDGLWPDDEAWAQANFAEGIDRAVRLVAAVWLGNAKILKAVTLRAAADEEIFRRGTALSQSQCERFVQALLGCRGAPHAERDQLVQRADAAFRILFGALVVRVVYGVNFVSERPLSDDQFVQSLVETTKKYLMGWETE